MKENADVVVFGSDYRTAPGTLKPGIAAHKLLLGGPAAVAVAPADLRSRPSVSVNTVGVLGEGDPAATATAQSLATALGASVEEFKNQPVDLLVVGSRPESPQGHVTLSAASDYAVEAATYPVIVIPRGVTVSSRRQVPAAPVTRMTAATSGSRSSIHRRASFQEIRLASASKPISATVRSAASAAPTTITLVAPDSASSAAAATSSRVTASDERSAFDQPWPKESSGLPSVGPSRI